MDTNSILLEMSKTLSEIRDKIHVLDINSTADRVRMESAKEDISSLQQEVKDLKSAHDRMDGMWKLLSAPGVMSAIYALYKIIQ